MLYSIVVVFAVSVLSPRASTIFVNSIVGFTCCPDPTDNYMARYLFGPLSAPGLLDSSVSRGFSRLLRGCLCVLVLVFLSLLLLPLFPPLNLLPPSVSSSSFLGQGLSASVPLLGLSQSRLALSGVFARAATGKSLHDYTVKDIDGKDVSLDKFKCKILLIVNVASKCGLAQSNYSELTHLYEKYKPQGFEILAFPCNQFGGQEPGSILEIKNFACTRFRAEFPIFDKVDVNGPNTVPVYQFLKSSVGGFLGDLVKWIFEKFLVDKNGRAVERYPATTSPFQIENDIKRLLAA